jgi:archaellum component FlaF (FlaF/FlaG flagellin family)
LASSLISGAVALLLILTGGYVIAGGIINIAESTMTAQADATVLLQKNLNSKITILYSEKTVDSFRIGVSNNGSTFYGVFDFGKMDVFIGYNDNSLERKSILTHYVFVNDRINQNIWDESEIINVTYSALSKEPVWVRLVTSNGVTASTNL